MNEQEIRRWLREDDPRRLEELWHAADQARRRCVGDAVHLRALVEISSFCVRRCGYCGLRAPRSALERYRMSAQEVLQCAEQARGLGCGTVVLQSGEDPAITMEWAEDLIRRLRSAAPELAITLSLGERTEEELLAWKRAGADRYLLRFETSNRRLYSRIHPPLPGSRPDRIAILRMLRRMGYEVGSGVMIGIPGQTYEDLARDIEFFVELELDMIGVGPYIPHPDTPLGRIAAARSRRRESPAASTRTTHGTGGQGPAPAPADWDHVHVPPPPGPDEQVPASEEMTCKVIALARLVRPHANIPSTTALATLNRHDGRELGLLRGANVVMPNQTPVKYRRLYEIYPNKACVSESPADCGGCLDRRIRAIGRQIGTGRGDARRHGPHDIDGAVACRVVCGKPRRPTP